MVRREPVTATAVPIRLRNLVAAPHDDRQKFLHRAEFHGTHIGMTAD